MTFYSIKCTSTFEELGFRRKLLLGTPQNLAGLKDASLLQREAHKIAQWLRSEAGLATKAAHEIQIAQQPHKTREPTMRREK